MSGVATAVVAGSVITGYMSSQASKKASQTQADATARAQDQLLAAGQEGSEKYQPWVTAGTTALTDMAANKDYFQNQFTNKDLNSYLAPGYEFRLGQGQKANMMASNATGGAVSGNALKSLQDYTQNFASGEYGNAFNQYQAQRTNIYNQLSDIAKMGLTGATGQANAIIGTGTNVANLTSGLGNAQAASQIAQGNAWANTAQGVSNAAAYYAMNQANSPQSTQSIMNSGGFTTSGAGNDLTGGAGFTMKT